MTLVCGMCPCNRLLRRLTRTSPSSHDARPGRRALQMPVKVRFCLYPCPCGYHGDPVKECTCSLSKVSRNQKRIPCPLLPRPPYQQKPAAHARCRPNLHVEFLAHLTARKLPVRASRLSLPAGPPAPLPRRSSLRRRHHQEILPRLVPKILDRELTHPHMVERLGRTGHAAQVARILGPHPQNDRAVPLFLWGHRKPAGKGPARSFRWVPPVTSLAR